jgi:glyoxylase-like metal-dependent hydrolase (beta-lactamase superfamily II)
MIGSMQMIIVEINGKKIAIDPSVGNDKHHPFFARWNGLKTDFLDKLGIEASEIDIVISSHLHPDHFGWNTTLVNGVWVPTFPNADYYWTKSEWDFWLEFSKTPDNVLAEEARTSIKESLQPIIDSGKVHIVPEDYQLMEGVYFEPSPGHSPGHISIHLESGDRHVVIVGDAFGHPLSVARPEWLRTGGDFDPKLAVQTRLNFLKKVADKPIFVIGIHWITPGGGYIVSDGDFWKIISVE